MLPLISMHADYLNRNMYNGGWNQFGGVNYSYGQLNAAGIPATAFLLLARECGAEVDEYLLQETLKHFYRFAGHGNVAYGNSMPDRGFVDNGKVGNMAFFIAAATLTPEGEQSVYSKARDISAVQSFIRRRGCFTATPAVASARSGAARPWGSCTTRSR